MGNSLYKFSDVESKSASPATLRQIIKDVLRADDDACATEIERFLLPPGIAGSREYDHCLSVETLLKHDALHGKRLLKAMDGTRLSRRMLWDEVVKVYRNVGFRFKHGRMIGVLEDKSNENNDTDEDSIE
jgi:hypothetical protein